MSASPAKPIDQRGLRRDPPFTAYWATLRGDWGEVDVPVLTEVIDRLWIGGEPTPKLPDGFDFVVNLYAPWATYDPNGAEVVNVEVDDGDVADEHGARLLELADEVNGRIDQGQTVLVHCQAGINRSASVAALVLMRRGMGAADAIRLLREKRHRLVLCNPHLERWLLGLGREEA